jgi:hypothetical protein
MAQPAPCVTIVDPARRHVAVSLERPPTWRPTAPVLLGAFLVLLLTAGIAAATSQRAARQSAEQAARDPLRSLHLVPTPAVRHGDQILVTVATVNTSRFPVQVTGLGVEGLLLVPSRRPPYVVGAGERQELELVFGVGECLGLGQGDLGAAPGESIPLAVNLTGNGGSGTQLLSVPNLNLLRMALFREHCRYAQ